MKTVLQKRWLRVWILSAVVCLLCLGASFPTYVYAQRADDASSELNAAILSEDWSQVVTLLTSSSLPPALTLVKAHALLALSKNNPSICLFLSVSSEDDLRRWDEWTRHFVIQNADKAIAHYFRGDALARYGQWDLALEAFNTALKLRLNHPLALNARGVVHTAKRQWNLAVDDFHKAIHANPSFADAYANYGALYIQKQDAPKGALKWFNEALSRSPNFAFALYGRGCAKLALASKEGQQDIQEAMKQISCIEEVIKEDLLKIAEWISIKDEMAFAESTTEDVGTTLTKILQEDIEMKNDVGSLNKAARILGQHPEYKDLFVVGLKDLAMRRPDLEPQIKEKVSRGVDWTRPNVGGARGFLNVLQGLQFEDGGKLGKASGKLGWDPEPFAKQHHIKTDLDFKGWDAMNRGLKESEIGGVTSSLAGAHLEEGDWPFVPHYGLLYPKGPQ